MPKKLFIIHEIIYFSKKLLFFQIRDFKTKITYKPSGKSLTGIPAGILIGYSAVIPAGIPAVTVI